MEVTVGRLGNLGDVTRDPHFPDLQLDRAVHFDSKPGPVATRRAVAPDTLADHLIEPEQSEPEGNVDEVSLEKHPALERVAQQLLTMTSENVSLALCQSRQVLTIA